MAKQPSRIDKYELIRRLGRGGMGTVYLARDPMLDRPVAIKLLRDPLVDDELLQRFLREARAAAKLRHENIITVYDVGQHDQQPFMAMEYVDGTSLAEIIAARQPLALGDKLSYLEQLCAGLHHAHAQGLVHRDVKPANVMVDGRGVIRVLDFGIARVEGSDMTRDGDLMGTLGYMSPEQMLGRAVDYRTDIFALGAVAYELLAYQQAFGGTMENGVPRRRPHEEVPPLSQLCPGLPPDLEPIVMRAMAREPEQRFTNLEQARAAIREVRRSIDPALHLEPIVPAGYAPTIIAPRSSSSGGSRPQSVDHRARPQSIAVDHPAPSRRLWMPIAAAAVAVVAILGGAAIWLRPAVEDRPAPAEPVEQAPAKPVEQALAEPVEQATAPPIVTPPAPTNAPASEEPSRPAIVTPDEPERRESAAPPPKPVVEKRDLRTEKPAAQREPEGAAPKPVVTEPDAPASSPPPKPVTSGAPNTEPAANPPVATPTSAAPPPAATTAATPTAPVPTALDRERPGILQALRRYQDAYRERSVKALLEIYPNMGREDRQRLEKNFRNCRDYDVTFGNMLPALNADDPTYATVTVRTTYLCQPRSGQAEQPQSVQDVFVLRKLGDGWLIDSIGLMR